MVRSVKDEPIMAPLVSAWRKKIQLAREHKYKQFGTYAAEAMRFYNGDHSFLWDENDPRSFFHKGALDGIDAPTFRMTYNIVAELVQLFGPVMYHRNPNRQVNPRQPFEIGQDYFVDPMLVERANRLAQQVQQFQQQQGMGPDGQAFPLPPELQMAQQMLQAQIQSQTDQFTSFTAGQAKRYAKDKVRAALMQRYLNYTPNELDLKTHFRDAIDECLIKGAAPLWSELYRPPGSNFVMAGTFHKTIDGFQIDPDCLRLEEATWIADLCVEPVWQVEKTYGWKKRSLKANLESLKACGEGDSDPWAYKFARAKGQTNDLLAYWKIWSKMGMGGRLKGMHPDVKSTLDGMGDYCHLVIADGCDQLINVPNKVFFESRDPKALREEVDWSTPFWADSDWPVTLMEFHRVPGQLWPMSHIMPGLGELKFLNFCMSFLANKVRTACDDLIAVVKGAEEELSKVFNVVSAGGYKILPIESTFGKTVAEIVSVMQMPPFHGDIWRVIAAVAERLDKRLGLTELAYGMSSRQFRSAEEVQQKQANFAVRPDDMANKVEDVASKVARKEAIMARWHLTGDDIAAQLGPEAGMLWDQLISTSDLESVMREFEYRIEANSTRKPNKDRDAANMQQVMQNLLQQLFQYGMTVGNFDPYNTILRKWGETLDMSMGDIPQLTPPPPPPPGSSPAEQEAMKLQMEQQRQEAEMQLSERQAQLDAAEQAQRMQFEAVQGQQELAQSAAEHQQEMAAKIEAHRLEMAAVMERQRTEIAGIKAKAKAAAKAKPAAPKKKATASA